MPTGSDNRVPSLSGGSDDSTPVQSAEEGHWPRKTHPSLTDIELRPSTVADGAYEPFSAVPSITLPVGIEITPNSSPHAPSQPLNSEELTRSGDCLSSALNNGDKDPLGMLSSTQD